MHFGIEVMNKSILFSILTLLGICSFSLLSAPIIGAAKTDRSRTEQRAAHATSRKESKRRGPDRTRLEESEEETTGDRDIPEKQLTLEALQRRLRIRRLSCWDQSAYKHVNTT